MDKVTNPLNVFKGPDSLRNYFNPDEQPPVPLVELPEKLNPFRKDGVRIYAKMLTVLPAQNVKALPALNMLLNAPSAAEKIIGEVSSGSTVTSLSITARVLYDNEKTTAFVSNKAALDRVRELQFYGLQVALYGGPTYTETTDVRGPVEWARGLGKSGNILNLGQYDNEHNWKSHEKWTGPQILKQLPEINIFCMGMGSTGCVTGTGLYLKSQKPSVKVLGVCNAESDLVPGPRERPMHETSPFPWKSVVDYTEVVSSYDSYRVSLRLSREGLISGPSSGMNLQGLFDFLQKEKDNCTLSNHADSATGEISCVFVCCDLPQKHVDTYFKKLSPDEFHPIVNEELFTVDQDVYSFRWEIDPSEPIGEASAIMDQIHKLGSGKRFENGSSNGLPNGFSNGFANGLSPSSSLRVVDLRSANDYNKYHVGGAHSCPVPKLTADTKTPFDFGDPKALISQWKDLNAMLENTDLFSKFFGADGPTLVLCYNGETSRLMTAMLRGRGVDAYSFRGGVPALTEYLGSQRSQASC